MNETDRPIRITDLSVPEPEPPSLKFNRAEAESAVAKLLAANENPLVQALIAMSRRQRRAFQSELARMKRKGVEGGLETCWAAAQRAGYCGPIPAAIRTNAELSSTEKPVTPEEVFDRVEELVEGKTIDFGES